MSPQEKIGIAVKPIIFSVDDDPNVLAAITRDLRTRYGQTYRIYAHGPSGELAGRSIRQDDGSAKLTAPIGINAEGVFPICRASAGDRHRAFVQVERIRLPENARYGG